MALARLRVCRAEPRCCCKRLLLLLAACAAASVLVLAALATDKRDEPLLLADKQAVSGSAPSPLFQLAHRWSAGQQSAGSLSCTLRSVNWVDLDDDRRPDLFISYAWQRADTGSRTSGTSNVLLLNSGEPDGFQALNESQSGLAELTADRDGDAAEHDEADELRPSESLVRSDTIFLDLDGDFAMDLCQHQCVLAGQQGERPALNCTLRYAINTDRPLIGNSTVTSSGVRFSLLSRARSDTSVPAVSAYPTAGDGLLAVPLTAVDWNRDQLMDVLHAQRAAAASDSITPLCSPTTCSERSAARVAAPQLVLEGRHNSSCCERFYASRVDAVLQPQNACVVTLLADVDADLQVEFLCFGAAFPEQLDLFHSTASGGFSSVTAWLRPRLLPDDGSSFTLRDACMGDYNYDGYPDYVLATDSGVVVLLSLAARRRRRYTTIRLQDHGAANGSASAIAVACFDADNDGCLDVFAILDDGLSHHHQQNGSSVTRTVLYSNIGPAFTAVTSAIVHDERGAGGAVVVADYDNDGYLDVLLAHPQRGDVVLFRNTHGSRPSAAAGRQHWLELTLYGTAWSNALAIGAIVRLTFDDGRRHVTSVVHDAAVGRALSVQHHQRLHFGLGAADTIEWLEIFWPSAKQQRHAAMRYSGVAADQHLHIIEIMTPAKWSPRLARFLRGYHMLPGHCARPDQHRLKPSFFIIGQWKCATTSLAICLNRHPQIVPSVVKEPNYFSRLHAVLDPGWYGALFPCGRREQRTFEASVGYLSNAKAMRRLLAAFPQAKLIVMLREPALRSWSHFRMTSRNRGLPSTLVHGSNDSLPERFHRVVQEQLPHFQDCVTNGTASSEAWSSLPLQLVHGCVDRHLDMSVAASLYAVHLSRLLTLLPSAGQLAVIATERLLAEPEVVLSELQAFIGVRSAPIQLPAANIGSGSDGDMLPATAELLLTFYRPFNHWLASIVNFTGGTSPSWLQQ